MPKPLAYILTDPLLRHVWIGGGMRRIDDVSILRIPRWDSRAAAQRAATALTLRGVSLVVTALSLATK